MDTDRFVYASAGTGKTHKISSTYVEIFDRSFGSGEDMDVNNVVAITFTKKAAAEMKSRILKMIDERKDADPAWSNLRSTMTFAWICTVDAFAKRILTEAGLFAGSNPGLQIGSGTVIQTILDKVIVLNLYQNGDLLEPLLGIYSLDEVRYALAEAVLQSRYNMIRSRAAGRVESGLPLHADPAAAEELVAATERFKLLFDRVYYDFLAEMKRENVTDFTGVVIALHDILSSEEHRWIKDRYSKQFKYIIVDEFQDTDSLQKGVIDLLRSEDNHVIYVGDAKQSIYRFRGAEVEVFSEARADVRARNGKIDRLDTNYRSHPDILRFCNAFYPKIFDGSAKPYSQSYESVTPLPVEGETAWRPRVKILFDPNGDEADAAARFVASIVGRKFDFAERKVDGDGAVKLVVDNRPIEFRDIVILLRKLRPSKGKEYMRALDRYGIPYYTVGESGLFDMPEITGILATLKVLSNPKDDTSMTTALMSPVAGLDVNDLSILRYKAKAADESIYGAFDLLDGSEFSPAKMERFEKFSEALRRYLPIKTLIKPSELVERVVDELEYEAYLATEDPTGRKTANLRKLIITARELDEAGLSLRELVRVLNKVGLDDEEQASIESEETDAVKIMTVHKAKGLEFPVVIVGDTSWTDRNSAGKLLFNKDGDGLSFTLNRKDDEGESLLTRLVEEEKDRDFEEEKRSLYVATTRASDMLVLTFSNGGRGRRPWRQMLQDNLAIVQEDGIEPAPGLEDVVEVVTPPQDVAPHRYETSAAAAARLDASYVNPVDAETYKEYVTATDLMKIDDESWAESATTTEEAAQDLRSRDLGILAHKIMESVGSERLADLGSCEDPWVPPAMAAGFSQDRAREVWSHLDRLKDHHLVKEIESSRSSRDEYEITRPFGRYILYGRPDKLIRTEDGWKIVDFKFAGSRSHGKAYEFQMKFYLYLAREIFKPMAGAALFYLKDGEEMVVSLEEDEVQGFEVELEEMIKRYPRVLGGSE